MQLTHASLDRRGEGSDALRELSSRIEAEYVEMPWPHLDAATGATVVDSGTLEAAGFVPCAFQIESPFQDEVGSLCRVRYEDAVLSVT